MPVVHDDSRNQSNSWKKTGPVQHAQFRSCGEPFQITCLAHRANWRILLTRHSPFICHLNWFAGNCPSNSRTNTCYLSAEDCDSFGRSLRGIPDWARHERNDSSVTTYQLSCLFHVLPQNKGFNLQQLSGEEPFIGKSFRFVAVVWSWSTSGWFVMENAENSNGTNLYQQEKGTSWIASCSSPRALWISEVFTSVVKQTFENGLKEHTTKHKNGKHQGCPWETSPDLI